MNISKPDTAFQNNTQGPKHPRHAHSYQFNAHPSSPAFRLPSPTSLPSLSAHIHHFLCASPFSFPPAFLPLPYFDPPHARCAAIVPSNMRRVELPSLNLKRARCNVIIQEHLCAKDSDGFVVVVAHHSHHLVMAATLFQFTSLAPSSGLSSRSKLSMVLPVSWFPVMAR